MSGPAARPTATRQRQPPVERRTSAHACRASVIIIPPDTARLFRERIGTHLKPDNLARRSFSAFHVERTARADRRPQSLALPAGIRIVDPPVHPFRVIPAR